MKRRKVCEDPDIAAIHEGKPCEGNGWYCDLCEDVDMKWEQKVGQELRALDNMFLNKERREELVQTWLEKHRDQTVPRPPKADFLTSLEIARKTRDKAQHVGTPMQCLREFLGSVYLEGGLHLATTRHGPWYAFAELWGNVEVLEALLPEDQERVKDILGGL
jgi:hypothetical protein